MKSNFSDNSSHSQTWVKVNAHVDIGIASLVSVLNDFHNLETIESCQGNQNEPAWVCFCYGQYWEHPWQELSEFVLGFLGPGLAKEIGDDATVKISLTGDSIALGRLVVRPGAINRTTKALKRLCCNFVC